MRDRYVRFSRNKEAIQQEARNAYYMKNYPDFFASVGKTMVKKSDGSFFLVDDIVSLLVDEVNVVDWRPCSSL